MNIYEVQPIFSHPTHPFELTIDAPGSKSITNRALMLAALANGETLLKGALFSDDSRHFLQCLKDLGFTYPVLHSFYNRPFLALAHLPLMMARRG